MTEYINKTNLEEPDVSDETINNIESPTLDDFSFSDKETNSEIDTALSENIPDKLSDFTTNKVHSYVKLSDKYSDIMSSAATMLLVGGIGIIFILLVIGNIITLPLNSETSWLFYSVMGGVFIIFIIAGIISFMHAHQVKIDAAIEDQLIENILNWSNEHLTKEFLDCDLDMTEPEEILYFARADKIKDSLMHEFESADEALINELTEQIYQKIYE